MNKVPPPGFSNPPLNSFGSGYSLGGDNSDPWASYGLGDQSPDMQSYIQYMHRYEQMLLAYRQMHPEAIATIDQYLALSQSYLTQVGDYGWDPMVGDGSGGYGVGVNTTGSASVGSTSADSSNLPTDQTGQIIWQESTPDNLHRVKYDGPDPVDLTYDPNTSQNEQKEFFQDDVTVHLPLHSVAGSFQLLNDDSVAAPAQMLKVTFKSPTGNTMTIIIHNFRKDKTHLHIKALDTDPALFPLTPLGTLSSQVDISDFNSATGVNGSSKSPIHPDHPEDTIPSSVNGATATYSTDDDLDLHAYFDGSVTTQDISTDGTVTLQADRFEVKFENGPPKKYVIIASGKDSAGNDKTITYTVDMDKKHAKKIILDVTDPSRVTGTAKNLAQIQIGTDKTISKDMPDLLKNLINAVPGLDLWQFAFNVGVAYPGLDSDGSGIVSIDEVKKAVQNGTFPPVLPDQNLVNLLVRADPKLANYLQATKTGDNNQYTLAMRGASQRLIDLLKTLYPDKADSLQLQDPPHDTPDSDKWMYANNIIFDGQVFQAFNEDPAHRGDVAFGWAGPAGP